MASRRTPRGGLGGGRPRNSRPGARGPGGRTKPAQAAAQRPRFTNRAAILLVVLAVLVVSYASSMRAYLRQEAHIAELKQEIATAKAAIAEGEREKRRWKDDAYVKAMARERFGWVMPGETAYQVIGRDGKPLTTEDNTLTDPGTVAQKPPEAWWTKAYGTLEVADHPERYAKPTPAERLGPPAKPKQDSRSGG